MPEKLAKSVGLAIGEGDIFARGLGVELVDIRPGWAVARMIVQETMSNLANIGHGGATFTLADTAFAYACNSRNKVSLAMHCSISYVGPVHKGDVLTAEAREILLRGRNGVYDVTVTNQDGEVVALFRGQSRQVHGQVVAGDDPTGDDR